MMRSGRLARASRLALVLVGIGALAGCKGLLDVTNQGAVDAENLNLSYIDILTNSVVGEFQQMTHWDHIYQSKFSGEVVNHMTFYEELDIGYRNLADGTSNGTFVLATYNPIHRVRWLADSVASRMRTWEGDTVKRDLRYARVLAYAGYGYVYLGEQFCRSPVNLGKALTPEEIFALATPRFEEAIQVAQAAKAWATGYTPDAYWSATSLARYAAGADSVMNFARVGAARAYLDLNNKAKAIEFASAVTPVWQSDAAPGFRFWAYFLEDKINNRWWQMTAPGAGSGGREISLYKLPYDGIIDPRVPQQRLTVYDGTLGTAKPVAGVMVPRATPAFSVYNATVEGTDVTKSSWLRIASAIEARYILAEAQGKNQSNIDFINSRRALGGMGPIDMSISDVDYRNAVIEQRTRDLFLDGHRLGDLRRYKKYYNLDLYPRGTYPTSTSVQYGAQECFPLPLAEMQANPNLR